MSYLFRLLTGWTGPVLDSDGRIGVTNDPKVFAAPRASGQAMPVCTDDKRVQLASLASAAAALNVLVESDDPEVQEACRLYGATFKHPPRRRERHSKTPKA